MRRRWKIVPAILITALAVAIACFAFVPSISRSISNGRQKVCYTNSYRLLNLLDAKMNGTEDNKVWYDLYEERNSNKLLSALKKELGDDSVDISDYYIKFGDGTVTILCKRHPETLDVTMTVPDNLIYTEEEYNAPQSDVILYITASGQDTYFQNSIMDKSNPAKRVFTNADNTNAIFPNINVVAHFAGGGSRILNSDEYKIQVGTLDMTKTGKRTLRIVYKGRRWPEDIFTAFEIDIVENDVRDPLIVDGGNLGKYELASWIWTDYVTDALDAPGSYMNFDASIVYDDETYYYFPDGFTILKENKDNGSIAGALDTNDHTKQAYSIIFDLDTPVYTQNVAQTIAHNGYLKLEDGLVYIWQDSPSKELDRGWIRVYCDMVKIN